MTLQIALLAMTFLFIFLPGCATIAGSFNPQVYTEELAQEHQFIKQRIPTSVFTLTAYKRLKSPGKPLSVYIEGDGRAWLSKNQISDDPTPFHPMTLELAAKDPSANVAYLGRPCQYDNSAMQRPCEPAYWSNKRFSEEVIVSTNEALDALMREAKASEIDLVGYSGGGAVAVLVAARRHDVSSIRTVAGNLDPEEVNRHHHVSSLAGSLDPMTAASVISKIPQRHFTGSMDKVVPASVIRNFIKTSGEQNCIQVTEVPEATHHSGWVERWDELFRLPISCAELTG